MDDDGKDFGNDTLHPPSERTGADVVALADFATVDPIGIAQGLQDYWRSLCQGRAVPRRADVEPRGINQALDFAFILERVAPGAGRFRLAGRHLLDLMGMEVRGMPLCSLIEAGDRGRLSDILETVFRAPQVAQLSLSSPAGFARAPLNAKLLLLPLQSDLGDISRALGCVAASGDIGRAPRRFIIDKVDLTPVIPGARVMEPRPSDHALAEGAEPWRPFLRPPSDDFAPPSRVPKREPPATPEERRAAFRLITRDGD
ncbi:MAG: PAS domain-containing protein [Paracoccus denitrificans]|nr:MAG: PAS domain-containing protein [Paracoccus denitrificans]PZO84148.1 MAG: PAS domain-containing protein [Paracoccus denitrificans]